VHDSGIPSVLSPLSYLWVRQKVRLLKTHFQIEKEFIPSSTVRQGVLCLEVVFYLCFARQSGLFVLPKP
jgi:hypothetical protein